MSSTQVTMSTNNQGGANPLPNNLKINALELDRFMESIDAAFAILMIAGSKLDKLEEFIEEAKFKSVNLEKATVKFLKNLSVAYGADAGEVLLKCLIVAVCYGINTSRVDRMGDAIKDFVVDVQAKGQIKKGNGVEKEDQMTWQRLLIAFPYAKGVFQELGIIQAIGTVPKGLPIFYAQQGGPAMASDALWADAAFQKDFGDWIVSQGKQLGRRNKNAPKKDDKIREDQMAYAEIQHGNPYSARARVGWWGGAATLRAVVLRSKAIGATLETFIAILRNGTVIPDEYFETKTIAGLWAAVNDQAVAAGVISKRPDEKNGQPVNLGTVGQKTK